eukprot:2414849-Pleurochrysis_carterae.AAC.1
MACRCACRRCARPPPPCARAPSTRCAVRRRCTSRPPRRRTGRPSGGGAPVLVLACSVPARP